jgi:hypothetical protein
MRGGSIPIAAWAGLLVILGALNWVWTSDEIQVGTFGMAAGIVLTGAAAVARGRAREAVSPGPPAPVEAPLAVPSGSVGAVLAAVALAALLFGFAFGRFLVYFGAGLLIAALGRVALEIRAERAARRSVEEDA